MVLPGDDMSAVLTEPAPEVSEAEAECLAREFFGVDGAASPLAGERDRNFRVRDASGRDWVLKVVHPAEDPRMTDLQSRVLLHISERDPALPVPRAHLPVSGGRADVRWERRPACRVRMYSYLPGQPMHLARPGIALRRSLGELLARLDLALADLRHPAAAHDLPWDAQSVGRVAGLVGAGDAGDDAGQILRALDHFAAHTRPALAGLRRQVIHNDFNPHNILLARVSGDLGAW